MYGQPLGVLARMLVVLLLIAATYNPSGYSWYHWVANSGWEHWIAKLFSFLILVAGYIVCIHATFRSLGFLLGVPLVLLILTAIWLASDQGWVDLSNWLHRTLVVQAALVVLLGTGTSFSIIRYRLAGQMDSRTLQ